MATYVTISDRNNGSALMGRPNGAHEKPAGLSRRAIPMRARCELRGSAMSEPTVCRL